MENTRDWLDFMKIRASWGQNGSIASLGNYMYAKTIASTGNYPTNPNSSDFGYVGTYAPSSAGNNELKWETSEQTNIGIDMRFLNNRLSFTADWYLKKTKDLIVTGASPSFINGLTASPINAGAAAMVAGLIVVPIVSLITPKMKKEDTDKIFACYEEKVTVEKKLVLTKEEQE